MRQQQAVGHSAPLVASASRDDDKPFLRSVSVVVVPLGRYPCAREQWHAIFFGAEQVAAVGAHDQGAVKGDCGAIGGGGGEEELADDVSERESSLSLPRLENRERACFVSRGACKLH